MNPREEFDNLGSMVLYHRQTTQTLRKQSSRN